MRSRTHQHHCNNSVCRRGLSGNGGGYCVRGSADNRDCCCRWHGLRRSSSWFVIVSDSLSPFPFASFDGKIGVVLNNKGSRRVASKGVIASNVDVVVMVVVVVAVVVLALVLRAKKTDESLSGAHHHQTYPRT